MRDGNNKTSLLANDPDVSLPYLIKSQVYTIPSLNAQRELRESLSRLKPDLVHASLTLSPLDFRLPELCHQLNLPLIATFHPAFDSKLRNLTANTQQLTYQLYAPSLAKYDKVIVFSDLQAEVLAKLGVKESRLEVIPNGIDIKKWNTLKTNNSQNELHFEIRKKLGSERIFIDTPKKFWIYEFSSIFSKHLYRKILNGTVDQDHQQIWSKKSFYLIVIIQPA